MSKSLAFGVMHVGIAFGVGYALTGSVAVAGAITFVEPLVNTVAHYFFDKAWERGRLPFGLGRRAGSSPTAAAQGRRIGQPA